MKIFSTAQSFGEKLSQKDYQNLMSLLEKMHSEDKYTKLTYSEKYTSTTGLEIPNIFKLSTYKLPAIDNELTKDEFVKTGKTGFYVGEDINNLAGSTIVLDNKDGTINFLSNSTKKQWGIIKKQLSEFLNMALKNYDNPNIVKKNITSIIK